MTLLKQLLEDLKRSPLMHSSVINLIEREYLPKEQENERHSNRKHRLKIWHISDTHQLHSLLNVPKDIDMVIFSGDCSNPKGVYENRDQVLNFIEWMKSLDVKYKIFVAGNHDTSIERNLITQGDFLEAGITYLENDWVEIEGLKIFGSPQTPTFGDWSFMKQRNKMHDHWKNVPDDIDIFVTHGPPKGILDLSFDRQHNLERCGDSALLTRCLAIKPKLVCFGHIHNCEDIINAGTKVLSAYPEITFSNGSVVTDGKFGKLSSNGNIFEL
jgi:Icc-related predicted phosphoesterase